MIGYVPASTAEVIKVNKILSYDGYIAEIIINTHMINFLHQHNLKYFLISSYILS